MAGGAQFRRLPLRIPTADQVAEILFFTTMEALLKKKDKPGSKEAGSARKRDLRNGVHGSLTIKVIDADAPPASGDDGQNLATPGFSVPEGQTTHE
jgi:hypothetical protein